MVLRPVRGLVALTISLGLLAACNAKTLGNAVPLSQVSVPKAQLAQDAQTVSQIQSEAKDMDLMADEATGFTTMVLGIPPATEPGMVSATGLIGADARLDRVGARAAIRAEARAKARDAARKLAPNLKDRLLKKHKDLRQKAAKRLQANVAAFKQSAQRTEAANDLGGKTFTLTFDYTLPNGNTRKGETERVYNADKVLVTATQTTDWTGKNGRTMHVERTKVLNEDGSYTVTGTATATVNGNTRTHAWTKTIAADGGVSGTGTLTRPGGTTVTITFGGNVETETATVTAEGITAVAETTVETGADTAVTVTGDGVTDEVAVTEETTAGTDAEAGASDSAASAS